MGSLTQLLSIITVPGSLISFIMQITGLTSSLMMALCLLSSSTATPILSIPAGTATTALTAAGIEFLAVPVTTLLNTAGAVSTTAVLGTIPTSTILLTKAVALKALLAKGLLLSELQKRREARQGHGRK